MVRHEREFLNERPEMKPATRIPYLSRVDDVLVCKRKFEIPSQQSTVFI